MIRALIYSPDDELLGEWEMPAYRTTIRVARQQRPTWSNDESMMPTITTVEFEVDRLDSLAHQLSNDDPRVWVYRQRTT
jgi:hypothetical protein